MIKKFSHLYFTLLLISFSCEDIVDVKIPDDGSDKLVVEAFLDTDRSFSKGSIVRLSRSFSFNESSFGGEINDAEIKLIGSDGKEIDFINFTSNSYFYPDTLQIGISYKLAIKIDENVYESTWQKTLPQVKIDSVGFLDREEIIETSLSLSTLPITNSHYPTLKFIDPANQKNFYSLDIDHSRYSNFVFLDVGLLVDDSDFVSGANLSFGNFWFNLPTLSLDSVQIKLSNISEETKLYFQQLQSIYSSQSPFSTPPFPTSQNIFNVNDPDEIVLGHFSIATTTRKRAKFIP